MFNSHKKQVVLLVFITTLFSANAVMAHDPIFGLGPHVLFKGGVEVSPEYYLSSKKDAEDSELGLDLKYGMTGDWAIGVELPYAWKKDGANRSSGQGDIKLLSKYRFWRDDGPGLQKSASVLLKIKTDTGDDGKNPKLGSGTTDNIIGLTYGYEGRKWYGWTSVRQRFNGTNRVGLQRGNKTLIDFVGGIRPNQTNYLEADMVWLLELNGEIGDRAELNGVNIANTGGTEWFVSPGIFWTKRNFAIKAGVQIPIASDLNGTQVSSDYRAKFVLEWHI